MKSKDTTDANVFAKYLQNTHLFLKTTPKFEFSQRLLVVKLNNANRSKKFFVYCCLKF